MANCQSDGLDLSAKPDDGPEADRVGYESPPRRTRFQPGQSGNPRGRPRGAKGFKQTVAQIAYEMHWVDEDGKRRRRSTLEVVLLQLCNLVAQGNVQAFRAYCQLAARHSPKQAGSRLDYLIVPEQLSIEEWQGKFADLAASQRRLIEETECQDVNMTDL